MSIKKCYSSTALSTELEVVRRKVSLQETEDSWDTIDQGIVQLTKCCNNGGCEFATEMVAAIRSLSGSLNNALNSERSRLSGSAIKLITALSTGLGPAFEPLISLFIHVLLGLCARANKLFVSRAKACIISIIEHTRSRSILSYLAGSVNHKSQSLRLAAAEGVLACLNFFKPSDSPRAHRFEDVIKLTTRDPSPDVRATGRKISAAYKSILSETVVSVPVASVVQKTEKPRTVVPASRQDAPPARGSQSIQSINQRRNVLRPLVPTTSLPQRMAMRQGKGPCVWDRPLRIPVSTACPPEINNAEKAQTICSPSVKLSSAPRSLVPVYNQKNNLVAAKIQSVGFNFPSTIRPSSQNEPRSFVKAVHPTIRGTSTQIGQPRPRGLLPKEVELQKVSSQAPGRRVVAPMGRPVTKGPKRLQAKAPAMRLHLCETKNPDVRKLAPEDVEFPPIRTVSVVPLASSTPFPSRHKSTASAQPAMPAKTPYTLSAPEGATRPPHTRCRIRQSPFRPRRHNTACMNDINSSPRILFVAAAPPHIHGARLISHTHTPHSPQISCF